MENPRLSDRLSSAANIVGLPAAQLSSAQLGRFRPICTLLLDLARAVKMNARQAHSSCIQLNHRVHVRVDASAWATRNSLWAQNSVSKNSIE